MEITRNTEPIVVRRKASRKKRQRECNTKLITLDAYHARLLHELQATFGSSHSRASQFCLDYAYDVRTDIKPFRAHAREEMVNKVFIPFSDSTERKEAEQFARTMYVPFTFLLKSAIRRTLDDLLSGTLTPSHPLVRLYFPKLKKEFPGEPQERVSYLIDERVKKLDSESFERSLKSLKRSDDSTIDFG
ncbi:hypothetical protein AWB71_02563 [Caballeronia peredens]|nr:hypothetical protein AWB71_02563 [Caballeronia peredens]